MYIDDIQKLFIAKVAEYYRGAVKGDALDREWLSMESEELEEICDLIYLPFKDTVRLTDYCISRKVVPETYKRLLVELTSDGLDETNLICYN
jgi:hypothetical protein